MKIASEIKKLSAFLKKQDFLSIPQNIRGLRSWVKELDSKNLIYMYVYINHHREGRQSGYLIISPPRYNDDGWERNPLAFGIPLGENWQTGIGYYDDYIPRLTNLIPSATYLKDAVIKEMIEPSNIATESSKAKALGLRELITIRAFRALQQSENFTELCQLSKETWFKQKKIYYLDHELGKKCFADYGDDITFQHIDSYTADLSMILATYSAFR